MGNPKTDPVLAAFIRSIENLADASIGVTLTTTGGVVSGELVSGTEWAKAYLEELEGTPAAPFLAETFEVLAKSLTPKDTKDEAGDGVPEFIHLTQARYLNANGMVPQGDTRPWRGRLDQVVAWSFGAMTTT